MGSLMFESRLGELWNRQHTFTKVCYLSLTKNVLSARTAFAQAQQCVRKDYGHGSVVCVCNATYCDFAAELSDDQLTGKNLAHYVSSKSGHRLLPMTMEFSSSTLDGDTVFTVNQDVKYQTMLGFGGATTDAATINLASLSNDAHELVLRSYFGTDGIGYTFIRVPLGGCDFSTHYYAYDDDHPGDSTLQYFNLTEEDYVYKIPNIKRAQELSPNPIRVFTAPWSAPDWMKEIESSGASHLLPEYYETYANYYVKFLQLYAEQGVDFWGLTPQNEPSHGTTNGGFNSMGWTSEQLRDWTAGYFVPALKAAGLDDIVLMILDDQRTQVKEWAQDWYGNESVNSFSDGMAVHWYQDANSDASVLTQAHEQYPDKFLLYTEACIFTNGVIEPILGDWSRAERYASSILQTTNNWVAGWIEWNLALSVEGGPSWMGNSADSPVIVNATADEFYKQPLFYALAHFSKFVPPGSVHIGLETEDDGGISNIAFLTPEGNTVVILMSTEFEFPLYFLPRQPCLPPTLILVREIAQQDGSPLHLPDSSLLEWSKSTGIRVSIPASAGNPKLCRATQNLKLDKEMNDE
uniref:Glucosylceramidase n=1 Tax=Timema tahoe TaxID=61484 RepID=A0A7R9IEF2_9NEOP|nr:unnamed protein product [Timema tahoe]